MREEIEIAKIFDCTEQYAQKIIASFKLNLPIQGATPEQMYKGYCLLKSLPTQSPSLVSEDADKLDLLAKYFDVEDSKKGKIGDDEVQQDLRRIANRLRSLLKSDEAIEILMELCQLKKHKDDVGKDSFYEKRQPELWEKANAFLNQRTQNPSKSDKENADELALKFAEWKRLNHITWHISRERPIQLKHKAGWFFKGKHYDTSELLQIFKQEQQKTGNNG